MTSLRDKPIEQKLAIVIAITTAAALILTGLGVVVADSILFRAYLRRDLSALTRIVGGNSTGALAFDDQDEAHRALDTLEARTHVSSACIYRVDATVLAKYSRPGAPACPQPNRDESIQFAVDGVDVSQPILLRGDRVGTLTLSYDLGEIGERIRLYGVTVFAVLLIASFVAFILASKLRSIIVTPISRLVGATTSVAETGDYSIRVQKLSGDEMGVLVDRFNDMLAGIQSRDADLKKALIDREAALRDAENERQRFRFMAESMPQKIFTAKPNGEVDYFNAQWMEFTGLTFDQIKDWGWTQFIHPDDLPDNLRAWRRALETGEPFQFEHRFRRANGSYRWHLSRGQAMRDVNGNITMWIGSNTDIHEQKEKERQLRRANEDLQQFAYSASHDLQEPIRNVAVYSEVVAKRYQSLLDDDGRQFLGFLREGGRRLAALVNDLLVYTRASMAELSETSVDSSAALIDSLASLAEAIRESHATVTYDSLPEVYMGEAHLQLIFQNLIGNALKYRGQDAPRIHVSACRQGAVWRFSVQDNGIGIDPRYKEKIFGIFKRLHHDESYAGTGIGLAICQRLVERYGGRIWVESEVGKGATFFFTAPQHAQPVRSATVQPSAG
ncbi:MAG TPA: ATP-binding protein [Bryobacteraceae bacterium]|jgi:PAS domain S-box-containing protein